MTSGGVTNYATLAPFAAPVVPKFYFLHICFSQGGIRAASLYTPLEPQLPLAPICLRNSALSTPFRHLTPPENRCAGAERQPTESATTADARIDLSWRCQILLRN